MKNVSVRIEGNIISAEILETIALAKADKQKSKDFGLDPSDKVKDSIAYKWSEAKSLYTIFKSKMTRIKPTDTGISETRRFWMLIFLDFLDYTPVKASADFVNGKSYAISHRAENLNKFPIHIMGFNQSLDKKPDTGLRMSPHALVQEYLNLTEHLYGIVTNGIYLRLLRNSSRLTRLSYLEFNLEQMMEEDLYADFALLYRTLHSSRMPKNS